MTNKNNTQKIATNTNADILKDQNRSFVKSANADIAKQKLYHSETTIGPRNRVQKMDKCRKGV